MSSTAPGSPAGRAWHRPRLLAAVLISAVVLGLVVLGVTVGGSSTPTSQAQPPTSAAPTSPSGPARDPGWSPTTPSPRVTPTSVRPADLRPVSVRIDAIDVRSDLLPLATDATGVLVPPDPYDVAGWFTGGPVPGDVGPAIIAGHVDSRAGPGVFFRLEEMAEGDLIEVTRSDRSRVSFVVTRVEQYPKNAFPTERVYGPTPAHELRLITCGGAFDSSRRSYLDNIVVYAVLHDSIT